MPRKRVKSKQGTDRKALRQKADAAWLLFWQGNDNDGVKFESREEMRQAWELVRDEYLRNNPLTEPPNYGPWGWWQFDTPEPFELKEIDGLDCSEAAQYQKRQALIKWGLLPADAPDPLKEHIQETYKWYEDRPSEKDAEYYKWKTACIELGLLEAENE
jgi:hypothetical protein